MSALFLAFLLCEPSLYYLPDESGGLRLLQRKEGKKRDKIDARKLADLLRGGYLRSVYPGENGLRTLKELARSYLTISEDLTRAMNRVRALYRSWGILCRGSKSTPHVIAPSG